MGAQFSKGGVAVEGKAAADPANAKANGQVSDLGLTCPAPAGSHMAPNAHWQHGSHGLVFCRDAAHLSQCTQQPRLTIWSQTGRVYANFETNRLFGKKQ